MALIVSPQLQGSVDQTARGSISDFTGLIKAATSDNIQPAALLACKQLGTELPLMSAETGINIEQLSRRKTNQPLEFMKARVGYFAGDSADLLSKTNAGMRFLCFVAIILSCGEADIQSAESLETILNRRACVGHPRPTLLQLLAFLRALKPKLAGAGFVKGLCIPAGLYDFFIALNQMCRLGEDRCSIRVECSLSYFPWVIAAVKWMLGSPPRVYHADGTRVIQSGLVGVSIVNSGDYAGYRVFRVRRVDSFDEILYIDDMNPGLMLLRGMVDVHTWIKYFLETCNIPLSICGRVLYTITKYVVPRIVLCTTMKNVLHEVYDTPMASLVSLAFHDLESRLSAVRNIVSGNIDLPEEDPNMDVMLEDIGCMCACGVCSQRYSEGFQVSPPTYAAGPPAWCVEVLLGKFAADVLTLSLFTMGHPAQQLPLLSFPPSRHPMIPQEQSHIEVTADSDGRAEWQTLIVCGWRPVLTGKLRYSTCSSRSIIEHAMTMVGYDGEKNAILTSSNGQVVYPFVLETGAAQRSGYLQLLCYPGSVRCQGTSIGALVSEERSHYRPTPDESSVSARPAHPTFPRLGVQFIPERTHHDHLTYQLTLRDQQEPPSKLVYVQASAEPTDIVTVCASPWDLLDGISQTIVSPSCVHRVDSPAGSSGVEFVLLRPDTDIRSYRPGDELLLIDHHEHPFHQLLQLAAATECCVLHQDGCISCALELAKRLGIKVVVC